MDINHDGRVGGGGVAGQVEKATHMDINRDGVIGGQRAPAGGGIPTSFSSLRIESMNLHCILIGIIGKAEQLTHMDLNHDGRIGGGAPQHKH